MGKKEKTESVLIRLDEVKQKNLNSNKTDPSHYSHWFLKCICRQFKTKIWILHILKISFKCSWELCPLIPIYMVTGLAPEMLRPWSFKEHEHCAIRFRGWKQFCWSDPACGRAHTGCHSHPLAEHRGCFYRCADNRSTKEGQQLQLIHGMDREHGTAKFTFHPLRQEFKGSSERAFKA